MKKIVIIPIILSLLAAPLITVSAEETATHEVENSIEESSSYSFLGDAVVENLSFGTHDGEVSVYRVINPDNSYQMIINDVNGERITEGTTDYQMFKNIAKYYQTNGVAPAYTAARGSDLTGKNYKHVYVGEGGTQTTTRKGYEYVANALGAYSALASRISLPFAVQTGVGSFLLGIISSNSPAKVTVSSTTYEVRFSYDDIYYTHCYHLIVKSYDDGGHLTSTKMDYYQSIGG